MSAYVQYVPGPEDERLGAALPVGVNLQDEDSIKLGYAIRSALIGVIKLLQKEGLGGGTIRLRKDGKTVVDNLDHYFSGSQFQHCNPKLFEEISKGSLDIKP